MNGVASEYSQMKKVDNILSDSDIDSEDESDSDTDTSDTISNADTVNSSLGSLKSSRNGVLPNYDRLTAEQKRAYHQICELFTKENDAIVAISARSGTGKTFLLTTLAQHYANAGVKFITFRRDEASGMFVKLGNNAKTYTYMSFYVRCLHLPYFRAVRLFNTSEADAVDLLYKLILYARKYSDTNTKIIIVDSCTIPSATMLLLLYILSLKHGIHLIFAGNKIQLSAMHKSALHNRTNFDLINKISDLTIRKLTAERSTDENLKRKLSQFHRMIQLNRPKNEVQFHFNLRYYLYCCFRTKYFTDERFDTVFMSQFHQVITDRLNRFIEYLKEKGRRYFVAPFYAVDSNVVKRISTTTKGKFFPGLILVEGYKYIHIDTSGVNKVVLLRRIELNDGNVDSLTVCSLQDGSSFTLKRCDLNYYQILPAYRTWLLSQTEIQPISQNAKLRQFPLRPYTLTYHAALGRTVGKEELLELSADCSFANSIYVGLCCVRNYDNIKKIHAKTDLPSFVVTDYMRKVHNKNAYYYRCPTDISDKDRNKIMRYVDEQGPNDFIDNLSWRTVSSIQEFERKKLTYYALIPRILYEKPIKKSQTDIDTPVMKIADFVNDRFDVIQNTMKNAPFEDIDKFNKKKEVQYRQSAAYVSLKKEYDYWCNKEE